MLEVEAGKASKRKRTLAHDKYISKGIRLSNNLLMVQELYLPEKVEFDSSKSSISICQRMVLAKQSRYLHHSFPIGLQALFKVLISGEP